MNNQGAIQCKVKLLTDGDQQEMRRFQLDDSSFASNFDLFKEKLRAVFPQLRDCAFKVTWTDGDGDVITIGNDEDLLMAMMEMNGLKVLEVHINSESRDAKEDPEEDIPFNVFGSAITCDVCNTRITRYRYKCLQCLDYDLCQNCEHSGNHAHHAMMRLVNLEIPRGLHKMVSHATRSARKAAHHAAREAHRCARGSAKAAHAAAQSAARASFRCPFQGPQPEKGQNQGQGQQVPEVPLFDSGVLYDLASSFLGPFMQGQTQGQGEAPTQTTNQAGSTAGTSGSAPGTGQGTPTASGPTGAPTNPPNTPAAPADLVGSFLRDVFSAINSNVAPAPVTPTPGTPTPGSGNGNGNTSSSTATATPDVVVVDPTPKAPTSATSVPMEVEQPNQPLKTPTTTAPIYPSVPQGPDAGWTFVASPSTAPATQVTPGPILTAVPATAPVAPVTSNAAPFQLAPPLNLNPDEVKYASQLGQLRRMGFSDNIDLLGLLKRYNGNIGLVVNHLFEHGN